MKILVIHQNYLAAGDPGGSRFNEMARYWTVKGHTVAVIAGSVNYSTGKSAQKYRGRWMSRERDGEVRVWRCYVPETYGRGYAGRAWALLASMISQSAAAIEVGRPDVIVASSPPLTVAVPGWIASRRRDLRIPWVFEIRDLWPESAITTGVLSKGSILARVLYGLEALACRSATLVNVLTPAFRDDVLQRGLAKSDKIVFIPNGADVSHFHPGARDNAVRSEFGWGSRIVALYAGAHGRANALGQLIEAAERMRSREDLMIACVGDGPERPGLESETRRRGLRNIVFHGPVPKDRMPALVQASDMGLAVLQKNPTFKTVYPNKVFDYMACSRPTVLAIDGVARKLVCEEAGAGVFAEPENPESLAAAIGSLADNPGLRRDLGERGRRWVLANGTREALADRFLGIFEAMGRSGNTKPSVEKPAARLWTKSKRTFDLVGSAALLLFLWPVLLIVALIVRLSLGPPILFRQERLGYRGRPFWLLKFRTMRIGPGTDPERLTPMGRFLRATSLDELPELWNVIRGEMSLVGPRPLLSRYRERYSPEQFRRHDVRPGITGWAQVNGRNALTWENKFRLDVWYVDHASPGLDLKILIMTLMNVLGSKGISAPGEATMPEFIGSRESRVDARS